MDDPSALLSDSQAREQGYPRVLIFSPEPFNRERGCGITLRNLFAGWPAESLACLHLSEEVVPDTSVCHRHLGLAHLSRSVPKLQARLPAPRRRLAGPSRRRLGSLLKQFDKKVGIRQWQVLFRRLQPGVVQWVAGFAPQVIYCTINSPAMLCLFQQLIAVTPVPAVVHVYDDWIAVAGDNGSLTGAMLGMVLGRRLHRALAGASVRMTIGDEMGRQYQRRYGMEFLPFQNPPSAEIWLALGRNNWTPGVPFRFRFVGNLYHDGNVQALRAFAEIVEAIHVQGLRVLLEVFTTLDALHRFGPLFGACPHTTFYPVVQSDEEMAGLYGTSDALVVAYDSTPRSRLAFGLSMPTKLPTSLLSGTPIVVYAPADSAVAKLICEEDCGLYLAPEEHKEVTARRLASFVTEVSSRERWARRGREVARRFSADVVRPAFQNALIRAGEYSIERQREH